MAGLQTQFSFTLPKGYVDESGVLHRHGTMRLATARDEIEPLRSRDIEGPDDPYLTVLVLARVITELGSMPEITTEHVENLFAADLAFLQDLYGIINFGDPADVAALQATVGEPTYVESAPTTDLDDSDDDAGSDASADAESDTTDDSGPSRTRSRIEEVPRTTVP
jgi:hypothetical protein